MIVLITGGTGSFGNAFVKRFVNNEDFDEIRIFSRDEKKQDDMRRNLASPKLKFYIGDVRDPVSVDSVVRGVDYIFHAAALKQVPSCEFFPMEAVKTNIYGTENVLNAAERFNVQRVVVLSTDKAAYPINAMGMSKALMEKVTTARSRNLDPNRTIFCATRYGNVMASRGSVIPLMISQIKSGIPLTITNPSMTRFMMTLDEAVNLVLYAFDNAFQGDLLVQKAPAATILTLAEALIELYQSKSKINVIGTRHGEKLFETLVSSEEMMKAQDLGDYFRIPADNRDLNYDQFFSSGESKKEFLQEYHSHNTLRLDLDGMKDLLLRLPMVRQDFFGNADLKDSL